MRESGFGPTVSLAEPDRSHRGGRDDNVQGGERRAIGLGQHRALRSPARYSASSWARIGKLGRATVTTIDARSRGRPRAKPPAASDGPWVASGRSFELRLLGRGPGLHMRNSAQCSRRLPLHLCPGQGLIKRCVQTAAFGFPGTWATRDHHQIPGFGKGIPAPAKPLAHRPLDAISHDGVAHSATGTDPHPADVSGCRGEHQENELAGCNPASLSGNPFEFS